jgi:threonine aldolase
MQLISKMRFVSVQFIAYLTDDLWKENALNSNNMGKYFIDHLSQFPSLVKLKDDLETNIIFAHMDKALIKALQEKFDFYVMDEEAGLIRLVTSFDTTEEEIDEFIEFIKNFIGS